MPEDEVGYVTVYLKAVLVQEQVEEFPAGNVEIIVACHGKVASNMLRVANWFLGTSNAHAIDMEMDESPTEIQKQIIGRVKNFDRNCEVLLLVDMGSLAAFGPIIREKTGLETMVVPGGYGDAHGRHPPFKVQAAAGGGNCKAARRVKFTEKREAAVIRFCFSVLQEKERPSGSGTT